ncbi:hypothetical protein [Myxosarcina sp. GI1(2024)]
MTTLLPSEDRPVAVACTKHYQSSSKVGKCYRADRQIKYLHLKAEIDLLWQKLQTLKQQKQDLEAQLSTPTRKSD